MSEQRPFGPNRPQISRRIFVPMALLLLAAVASYSVAQQPGNIGPARGRQISLRRQLTAGLKAFSKADKAFINKVVLSVEQGKLPRRMVDLTFLWARKKATYKSYNRRLRPIVYFKPGLTLQAKKIGLKL